MVGIQNNIWVDRWQAGGCSLSIITHKTDAGGICLDVRSDTEVRLAYQQIIESAQRYKQNARVEGVTIQPFLANPDFEILLGAKRDPDFGPVILFGMGGIFTEVLKDKALGLPPMNRLLARRMIQETKTYTLLRGYPGRRELPRSQGRIFYSHMQCFC